MSRQQRRALARQQAKASYTSVSAAPAAKPDGPRTPEGKAISSRNALFHGLTSAQVVLPWENQADFDELLNGLMGEHQPATITETIMVREMAEQYWRLIRARNQEHAQLSLKQEVLDGDVEAFLDWEKKLQITARYVTRFERAFHKCLAMLRTLQKERRIREAEAPEIETGSEPEEIASKPEVEFVWQNRKESEFVRQNEAEYVMAAGHAATLEPQSLI